jgi:hypothetical protein
VRVKVLHEVCLCVGVGAVAKDAVVGLCVGVGAVAKDAVVGQSNVGQYIHMHAYGPAVQDVRSHNLKYQLHEIALWTTKPLRVSHPIR